MNCLFAIPDVDFACAHECECFVWESMLHLQRPIHALNLLFLSSTSPTTLLSIPDHAFKVHLTSCLHLRIRGPRPIVDNRLTSTPLP